MNVKKHNEQYNKLYVSYIITKCPRRDQSNFKFNYVTLNSNIKIDSTANLDNEKGLFNRRVFNNKEDFKFYVSIFIVTNRFHYKIRNFNKISIIMKCEDVNFHWKLAPNKIR